MLRLARFCAGLAGRLQFSESWAVALEHYADFGRLSHFESLNRQHHANPIRLDRRVFQNLLPFVVRTHRKSPGSIQFCGRATAEMGRSTYARADSQVRRRDRMRIQIDSSVTLSPPSGQSQEIFELQICAQNLKSLPYNTYVILLPG
jgi:hypothetical protein